MSHPYRDQPPRDEAREHLRQSLELVRKQIQEQLTTLNVIIAKSAHTIHIHLAKEAVAEAREHELEIINRISELSKAGWPP